jgi:predicted DsbA family dithiol-disulfide isomerase
MKIDFVSDVACPWCAVGLNALELALQQVEGEIPVNLHFQPFELNPAMDAQGTDAGTYLCQKYGMSEDQLASNRATLRQRGAEVGFAFGDRPRVWNTFDAHRLLHWAGLAGPAGSQRALKHALLEAYHGQARNPGDADVLVELAQQVGLDPQAAREVIASGRYSDEVRTAERYWQEAGIHSVPSIVIDDRHLIQGGQTPAVFAQALRQIAAGAAQAA